MDPGAAKTPARMDHECCIDSQIKKLEVKLGGYPQPRQLAKQLGNLLKLLMSGGLRQHPGLRRRLKQLSKYELVGRVARDLVRYWDTIRALEAIEEPEGRTSSSPREPALKRTWEAAHNEDPQGHRGTPGLTQESQVDQTGKPACMPCEEDCNSAQPSKKRKMDTNKREKTAQREEHKDREKKKEHREEKKTPPHKRLEKMVLAHQGSSNCAESNANTGTPPERRDGSLAKLPGSGSQQPRLPGVCTESSALDQAEAEGPFCRKYSKTPVFAGSKRASANTDKTRQQQSLGHLLKHDNVPSQVNTSYPQSSLKPTGNTDPPPQYHCQHEAKSNLKGKTDRGGRIADTPALELPNQSKETFLQPVVLSHQQTLDKRPEATPHKARSALSTQPLGPTPIGLLNGTSKAKKVQRKEQIITKRGRQ